MSDFNIGEIVIFSDVPGWLIHDLPDEDKQRILERIGNKAIIQKVEPEGYFWLGFDLYETEKGLIAHKDHWFCVTEDCMKRIVSNEK